MDFVGMDKKVLQGFVSVHEILASMSQRDREILEIIKDLESRLALLEEEVRSLGLADDSIRRSLLELRPLIEEYNKH